MSTQTRPRRLSVTQIQARKGGEKIVCLTAYTASVARHLDAQVDLLLVGDSLAMTVYGFDSTLPVTLDMMVAHGAAVVRATAHALITVDLPFGSYQESPEQAFRAAARVLAETGCAAVKLEGGEEMAETVAFLVRRGIPVMGHVGLTPQAVNALGGYRSRGHADAERDKIMRDGVAVAEAGAFSLVIEGTAESVARELTEAVAIPTIGIGGSRGLRRADPGHRRHARPVRRVHAEIRQALPPSRRRDPAKRRANMPTRSGPGRFPAEEHTYRAPRRAKSATGA